jgi:uncharacterized protein (DUF305 family)
MKKLAVLLAAVALLASACGGDDGAEPTASGAVPFDLAFIDAMVPHHREAIEMAEAARSQGLREGDLEQIASNVIATQQREIDLLLEWREEWFGSRTLGPVLPEVLGVDDSELGMGHGSVEDLLDAHDVDATFAAMMIPHHEGAVAMAEEAEDRAEHEEIRDLAARIIEAQEAEIAMMEDHAAGQHG